MQGAIAVNDWLTNQIKEHQPEQSSGVTEDAVRDIVRTEIRHALADASSAIRDRQLAEPTT